MLKQFRRLPAFKWPWSRKPRAEAPAEVLAHAVEATVDSLGKGRAAQVAPAVILATGAGVALLWWTQWARGSAESETTAREHDLDSKPD